jgi:hypothetical protein
LLRPFAAITPSLVLSTEGVDKSETPRQPASPVVAKVVPVIILSANLAAISTDANPAWSAENWW